MVQTGTATWSTIDTRATRPNYIHRRLSSANLFTPFGCDLQIGCVCSNTYRCFELRTRRGNTLNVSSCLGSFKVSSYNCSWLTWATAPGGSAFRERAIILLRVIRLWKRAANFRWLSPTSARNQLIGKFDVMMRAQLGSVNRKEFAFFPPLSSFLSSRLVRSSFFFEGSYYRK